MELKGGLSYLHVGHWAEISETVFESVGVPDVTEQGQEQFPVAQDA